MSTYHYTLIFLKHKSYNDDFGVIIVITLYRDSKVKQKIIDAYEVGMKIVEPAYVDCSHLRGGILNECNIRYLIVSNLGKDFGELNVTAQKLGLVVFARGLVWQVLDKYTLNGVTQILIRPRIEDSLAPNIITSTRMDFNELRYALPVLVLDTNEWKDRLFFPVGVKDDGRLKFCE